MAGSGQLGREQLPVAWYHLDASRMPVEEAARAAIKAVRPLAGTVEFDDLALLPAEGRAIAHLKGARATAAIDVRGDEQHTTVRVVVEMKPTGMQPR